MTSIPLCMDGNCLPYLYAIPVLNMQGSPRRQLSFLRYFLGITRNPQQTITVPERIELCYNKAGRPRTFSGLVS